MTLQELENQVTELSYKRLRMQRASSAAASIMYKLNIPEGTQLAFILNQPSAKTNKEAISGWILGQTSWQLVDEQSYNELAVMLERFLFDYGRRY